MEGIPGIICGYLNLNDLETSLKLFNQMKNQDLNLKVQNKRI